MTLLKQCELLIWLCLLIVWCVILKPLNKLPGIDTLCRFDGLDVPHRTAVNEVFLSKVWQWLIYLLLSFVVVACFMFSSTSHYLLWNYFTVLFHIEHLTYCNVCFQFLGYQATDITSLRPTFYSLWFLFTVQFVYTNVWIPFIINTVNKNKTWISFF